MQTTFKTSRVIQCPGNNFFKRTILFAILFLTSAFVFAQKEPDTLEEKQSINRQILFDTIQEKFDFVEETFSANYGADFLDPNPYNIVSYEILWRPIQIWGSSMDMAGFYETGEGYFLAAMKSFETKHILGFELEEGEGMSQIIEYFGQPDDRPYLSRKNTYYNRPFDLYITFYLDGNSNVESFEVGKTGW